MHRILPLAAALALAGCGKKDPDSGTTPAGTAGGTLSGVTTGNPSTGNPLLDVVLEEGPVITCANPQASLAGRFARHAIEHTPASGSYTWGGGVIAEDFNGDGTLDLVLANEDGLQLVLTTLGETPDATTLDEVPGAFGGMDLAFAVGGTAADVDADGDKDLLIARWGEPNALLINDGSAGFTDATPSAWQSRSRKTQTASVADMDGDGHLDVFFGASGDVPTDPASPPPADPSELYRGVGGGSFEDASSLLPRELHDGYTTASGWWNVWGTDLPELVVANDHGKAYPTVVARNSSGSFTADTGFHPDLDDRGLAVADVNGDGQPDFLFPSRGAASILASGISYGQPGFFQEVADRWLVEPDPASQVFPWGVAWADLKNKASLDAVVAYGHWSDHPAEVNPIAQPDALFEQTGLLSFSQTAADGEWGIDDPSRGRGVAVADLNDDGYLDVIKGHPEGNTAVYLSRCAADNWSRIRLVQDGGNRDAIGARIQVVTGSLTQTRWIHAGSSGVHAGMPVEAHFGLGPRDRIEVLTVTWPDGRVDQFQAVSARTRVTITRTNAP